MIPTAEEFFSKHNMTSENGFSTAIRLADIYANMKAAYYVDAALKAAAENAESNWEPDVKVKKETILNAYDLDNIK